MRLENIADIYELSPTQQGILFHSLYAPESDVYFGQFSCVLQGDLNCLALEQAWNLVVARHSSLRTAFQWEGLDQQLQVVYQQVNLPLEQHDWRSLSEIEQQQQLEVYLQQDRQRGFNLAKAPLMRLALIQMAEDTYQFVWSKHHLILDGWSTALVLKQVLTAYAALCEEQVPEISSCPFGDYIEWLQQQNLSAAEVFWRQALRGFTAPTPLGVDRRGDRSNQSENDEQQIKLSAATTADLRLLARKHQLTLNTLLLGAWGLLLSRYSGETDVVFGATVSGRPATLAGAESMVGLLINTLPVRVKVTSEEPLLPWLQQLQAQQAEVRQYEYSPLVQVQGWSEVPQDLPLFESIVVFENYPVDPALSQDQSLKVRDVQTFDKTNYPLTLVVQPDSELLVQLCYDCQRFDSTTIARMLGHLQTLLVGMVAAPEQQLSDLSLLTPSERHQLLVEWNCTQADVPRQCIHELFETQVERTPDAIAVVFVDQQLTYRELNHRANQLAHHLQMLGAGAEVKVGICVERSLLMVVGLLAILKAGGTYVPLDPNYPQERIAFVLEDTKAPVLLTQASLVASLPADSTRVVCLDTDWEIIAQSDKENLQSEVTPENLAYAIYTSGSTGKPKGVQIPHRAVVNFLTSMSLTPGLTAQDILLSVTTISFDIAGLEIFLPLTVGGQVVVVNSEVASDGYALSELLRNSDATVMQATPATWRLLLEAGWQGRANLKLLCGGEAMPWDLASQLLKRVGSLWNMYGPTETTIWSTVYQVEEGSELISIGRPIANTQIYLLDSFGQPVPVGVPGELHIGGVGLAKGYLNRPELTAEKFISHPYSDQPSDRLYKTGDLARYLPDGNIECLGRIDHQVKIRGFRIELKEIEALLSQHLGVRETVVLVREEQPGNNRLVAYVVPQEQSPTVTELHNFLQDKLPKYMMPSAFVLLEALPLTPNGKVDRRALSAPDWSQRNPEQTYVAPRTPVEEILTGIWSQVLGVEQVSVDDNFFERGGHSLLATQLISKLRNIFQIELPLRHSFEFPTVATLAESIEAMKHSQNDIQTPPIRLQRDSNLPLSFAQQRLWFLNQLEPNNPLYNISEAVHLTGVLNIDALEQSLNEIIRRHEVLRTTFMTVAGQPVQIITPTLRLTLPIVDLQALAKTERESEAKRLATKEAQQPFDLAQGPLWRCSLLQLDKTEHVVLLTMHHIIFDGWSTGVLLRELTALYEAFSKGKPSPLPELSIQYVDFAAWQQQWLQGEVLKSQISYWQQQLAGASPVLALPTDRPRSAVQTFWGATQSLDLCEASSEALKRLSQQEGVTLFMTLVSAFKTLLYRYTGQADILVGTPIANRNCSEIEPLIGFFVNTLVLRTDLSGNPTFRELLSRVREVALGAYAHQDLPFEKLVELQPERSLSHTPLFQVMFVFQSVPMMTLEIPSLSLKSLESSNGTAKFDLTLYVEDTKHRLISTLEYNTDLFDAVTISRMLGHFQVLLESIVANPNQKLSDLPLLKPAERHQLLVEFSQAESGQLKLQNQKSKIEQCLHCLFEAQVKQTPDAIALSFQDHQLTYQELNQRANQLAHYLQKLGIGLDMLVGICLERSLEMVIGMLGVLKVGAAYVPLDPGYPQERLAFMLADAQTPVLLTQQWLVEKFSDCGAQAICLDTDWEVIAQEGKENLISGVTADNLAYVIYTSGSTGTPKGVTISHRAICNHMSWMQADFPLTKADRVLQKTPFSFDASVWEFYAPLLAGGRLLLARPGGHQDSAYLINLIAEQQVTILQLVPSQLRLLLEEQLIETCKCLRRVFCGGEALPIKLQERFFSLLDADLHNLYGPTEAAIDTTVWRCKRGDNHRIVPIGRAIANVQVYLLDSHLQPVPVGVPGELYIGGDGLARGYLNQPELTALKFIPNPYSDELGARLYKTGDLARYRSDGSIEFLGRSDRQVKVRGFRIELGEIEALLSQHPKVGATVVVVREEQPGDKRLVAYVVSNQEQSPTVSELCSFLNEKLPKYMVPSTFVFLSVLPLTPNGKVDHRALPAPDTNRPVAGVLVAPRTPNEETLARIWTQVLRFEQVGVHDNFFELGGDSILSIQIVARANQAGLQLTPKQMFEHQTIAELAVVASTNQAIQAEQGLVTGQVPLTPIQHWFFEQNLPNYHHWNQSILLEVRQALDPSLLEQAVQKLLQHHDALRLRFVYQGSIWQQVNAECDEVVPFTRIDLSTESQTKQGSVISATAAALQTTLNLSKGPLMRVALFELGAKPSRLLIVIHHLVVDGVSWRILLEDLQTTYQQLSQGEAMRLPPKTTSFKQWAERLTQYGQSVEVKLEQDYWLNESRQQVFSLPVDYPGGDNTLSSARVVSVALSQAETRSLLQEVPAVYQTQINDVLLTALIQAFMQWTGKRSLLVDLEGHGREEIIENVDLSRTVGWFTTIFPVLLSLGEASDLEDALKAVKEQLRSIPHRGINYGVLRYLSSGERTAKQLQALLRAEVRFNYLGQSDQVLSSTLFRPALESSGPNCSQIGTRSCLLDINGIVAGGQLRLDWTYSESVHQRATVEGLAQGFMEALRSLIAHCQSPIAGGYTPSDFPQMQFSQQELDQLITELSESEGN